MNQIRSSVSSSPEDFASSLNLSRAWDGPRTTSVSSTNGDRDIDKDNGLDDEADENEQFLNDLRAASGIGRIRRSAKVKEKGKGKAPVCTKPLL